MPSFDMFPDSAIEYLLNPPRSEELEAALATPALHLNVYAIKGKEVWPRFKDYHYMTAKYSGHRAWLAALPSGEEVAFISVMRFPHGHITNGWREHRTAVLPDFQGLGIGVRFGNWMGHHITTHSEFVDANGNHGRLFSRTVSPRLGLYRNDSDKWRATPQNMKIGSKPSKTGISSTALIRVSYSHEYVGQGGNGGVAR